MSRCRRMLLLGSCYADNNPISLIFDPPAIFIVCSVSKKHGCRDVRCGVRVDGPKPMSCLLILGRPTAVRGVMCGERVLCGVRLWPPISSRRLFFIFRTPVKQPTKGCAPVREVTRVCGTAERDRRPVGEVAWAEVSIRKPDCEETLATI